MTTRLDSFATAITRFSEALGAPPTDLTRDAAIQRNRTAHTYDETLAKDVYRRLPTHLPLLQALKTYLRSTQT